MKAVMNIAMEKMLAHLRRLVGAVPDMQAIQIEAVLFSNVYGILAMSEHAEAFIKQITLKGDL